MSFQIKKKKPENRLAETLCKTRKKLKWMKIRLFLLITLPMAVIAIGHAVIKEYVRIRIRQAAKAADGPGSKKAQKTGGPHAAPSKTDPV